MRTRPSSYHSKITICCTNILQLSNRLISLPGMPACVVYMPACEYYLVLTCDCVETDTNPVYNTDRLEFPHPSLYHRRVGRVASSSSSCSFVVAPPSFGRCTLTTRRCRHRHRCLVASSSPASYRHIPPREMTVMEGEGGSFANRGSDSDRRISIPSDFILPVSSFAKYGGHSLHVRYASAAAATPPYVRSHCEYNESPAPGKNITQVLRLDLGL
jgi:hypothetical protein